MRDEQQLLDLRPDLQLPTQASKPEEQFQNQTLRPILKMQHALLSRLFLTQILQHKTVFFNLSKPDRMEWIARTMRANTRLRHLLIGVVVGCFTMDELRSFEAHESECTRRLVHLLVQRLQSVDFGGLLPTSAPTALNMPPA